MGCVHVIFLVEIHGTFWWDVDGILKGFWWMSNAYFWLWTNILLMDSTCKHRDYTSHISWGYPTGSRLKTHRRSIPGVFFAEAQPHIYILLYLYLYLYFIILYYIVLYYILLYIIEYYRILHYIVYYCILNYITSYYILWNLLLYI